MWREPAGYFACEISAGDDRPTLAFFAGGPSADDLHAMGPDEIREEILEQIVATLGPQAGEPLDMVVRDWTDDPYSAGAYSDLLTMQAPHDAEAVLRVGTTRLRFASSKLSPSFPGYVEGAIIAGRSAADQLLGDLRRAQSAIATSASGS